MSFLWFMMMIWAILFLSISTPKQYNPSRLLTHIYSGALIWATSIGIYCLPIWIILLYRVFHITNIHMFVKYIMNDPLGFSKSFSSWKLSRYSDTMRLASALAYTYFSWVFTQDVPSFLLQTPIVDPFRSIPPIVNSNLLFLHPFVGFF